MNFGFSILDFRLSDQEFRTRSEAFSFIRFLPNPKSKIENPKWVGIFVIALTFAFGGAVAHAQQTGKIFRIGILDSSTASGIAVLLDAFRQELGKLGWIVGKNITIEYRFAEQKPERL